MPGKNRSPLLVAAALGLAIVATLPAPVPAQTQVRDEIARAWILRDAPDITRVHYATDEACFFEFEEQCFGGMMAPDSVLCVLDPVDEAEWPDQCIVALECTITDPSGEHMFDGGGMHQSMMRTAVLVTVHYSPDSVSGMGLDPSTLCLARVGTSGLTVCEDAVHDIAANTFVLSTVTPASTFVVVPRAALVESAPDALSNLKTHYLR